MARRTWFFATVVLLLLLAADSVPPERYLGWEVEKRFSGGGNTTATGTVTVHEISLTSAVPFSASSTSDWLVGDEVDISWEGQTVSFLLQQFTTVDGVDLWRAAGIDADLLLWSIVFGEDSGLHLEFEPSVVPGTLETRREFLAVGTIGHLEEADLGVPFPDAESDQWQVSASAGALSAWLGLGLTTGAATSTHVLRVLCVTDTLAASDCHSMQREWNMRFAGLTGMTVQLRSQAVAASALLGEWGTSRSNTCGSTHAFSQIAADNRTNALETSEATANMSHGWWDDLVLFLPAKGLRNATPQAAQPYVCLDDSGLKKANSTVALGLAWRDIGATSASSLAHLIGLMANLQPDVVCSQPSCHIMALDSTTWTARSTYSPAALTTVQAWARLNLPVEAHYIGQSVSNSGNNVTLTDFEVQMPNPDVHLRASCMPFTGATFTLSGTGVASITELWLHIESPTNHSIQTPLDQWFGYQRNAGANGTLNSLNLSSGHQWTAGFNEVSGNSPPSWSNSAAAPSADHAACDLTTLEEAHWPDWTFGQTMTWEFWPAYNLGTTTTNPDFGPTRSPLVSADLLG